MSRTILVVGAGAIGGPLVLALTADAAAVGSRLHVRFCDEDTVERSNLQRQIQFRETDIGKGKVSTLAARLARKGIAPHRFEAISGRFETRSADALLDGVDLVIDASDNFETKFCVNDAAVSHRLPALIASCITTKAQLFTVCPGRACYRCLFETSPEAETGTCSQIGVLAAIPSLVAGHAAKRAVELLEASLTAKTTKIPTGPTLIIFDPSAPWSSGRRINLEPRPDCRSCSVPHTRKAEPHGNRTNPNPLA